LFLC
jgi:hypothetical protein